MHSKLAVEAPPAPTCFIYLYLDHLTVTLASHSAVGSGHHRPGGLLLAADLCCAACTVRSDYTRLLESSTSASGS